MKTRRAVWGVAFGFTAIAVIITVLVTRNRPTPEEAAPPVGETFSEQATAVQPEAPDTVVQVSENLAPESARHNPETVAPANPRTGTGTIFGKVIPPHDAPKGLAVTVSLHLVNPKDPTDQSTELRSLRANDDGTFVFDRLPQAQYILFADADGYTANTTESLLRYDRYSEEAWLRLAPAAPISGRVLNAARQPVADASVFLAAAHLDGRPTPSPRERAFSSRQATNADGHFDMPRLQRSLNGEPGFRLAVKAEGYASYVSDYIQAGTDGVEFVLSQGGVVSGRIVDAESGAPLPSKTISLDSEFVVETQTVQSDVDGFFFVSDVRPAVYVAALQDDDLVLTPGSATVAVSESGAEVELKAARGGSISGRVTQLETGTGIPNAPVTAYRGTDRANTLRAQTDASGVYRFARLKPGAYTVALHYVRGFAPDVSGADANSRRVSVPLRDAVPGVDFTLARGLRVSGTVLDDTGKPVLRVGVNASSGNRGLTSYAFTDEHGAFLLAGFEPNSDVRLNFQRDGYAMVESPLTDNKLQLAEVDVTGQKFVMGIGATVSGVVVDTQGRPKRHVQLFAHEISDKPRGGDAGLSSINGEFTIEGLSPGRYRVQFNNRQKRLADDEAPTVTVARGERVTGVRLVYPDTGELTISGRVTNARGLPVQNASVELASGEIVGTSTDANGQFTLEGVPEGSQQVNVHHNAQQASQDVNAGDSGVVIVLKDLATVSGQVLDAVTNQPIPIFVVNTTAVRDPHGQFEVANIGVGTPRLRVSADEYAAVNVSIPPLQEGEHRNNVVIRLEPAVQLTGRVADRSGKGIVGARVSASPAAGADQVRFLPVRATTLTDGHFSIGPLPARAVKITASRTDYRENTVDAVLAPGGANRVDIVLSEGAVIEGLVTVNGKPASRTSIQVVSPENGNENEARTDAQGRYRVTGLRDGSYQVTARLQDTPTASGRTKSVNATIAGNAGVTANIAFRIETGSVSGRVYRSENEAVGSGVHLNLANELADGTTETYNTTTDANGEYAFTGISAGNVRLHLFSDDTSRRARFTLADGEHARKDFHIDVGKKIRVEVSGGAAARAREVFAVLFEGEVAIPELSEATMEQFNHLIVATDEIDNGVAELGPVEPGTYTVLVAAGDFSAGLNADGTMPADWTTQVIQIDEKGPDTLVIRVNL